MNIGRQARRRDSGARLDARTVARLLDDFQSHWPMATTPISIGIRSISVVELPGDGVEAGVPFSHLP